MKVFWIVYSLCIFIIFIISGMVMDKGLTVISVIPAIIYLTLGLIIGANFKFISKNKKLFALITAISVIFAPKIVMLIKSILNIGDNI